MLIYALVCGAATGVLVLSMLFDGVLDVFDLDADGPFNLMAIAAFLVGFGAFGWAASAYGDMSAGAEVALALVGGAAMFSVPLVVTRGLRRQSTSSNFSLADFAGLVGTVVVAIPAGGFGTVSVTHQGESRTVIARASGVGSFEQGQAVRVTQVVASVALVEAQA